MRFRNCLYALLLTIKVFLFPFSAAAQADASESPLTEEAVQGGEIETIEAEIIDNAARIHFFIRLGLAVVIVILQIVLIRLMWYFFTWIKGKITIYGGKHFKPLTIKKFRIMETAQILNIIFSLLNILKYIITVFQFFITVPIVFSFFPLTKNIASTLFGYILTPLKTIGINILHYIPNLIPIVIILMITNYVIRSLKFFATRIEKGKLVIPGFYPDWAQPTFNILRILLYAFTVAVIYPYLPGSDSKIFQGVSVFVGVILSLGSSSAIGNLVAGLVITYMRPFKIGDRIKLNDATGFVVEKSAFVIRIKTHKNEYITFPNIMVLSSSIINYHTSSVEDAEGLILYANITFGYNTPWQTVRDILIGAALNTNYALKQPKPFVLQTSMDDFYATYQINLYTKEVDKVPAIYSQLYENIQNGFHAAGLDMTAAHYRVHLPPETYTPLPEKPSPCPAPAAGA
ncbi:MAG: mechanosensitive ion channel family protein [Spirochaetaceae bacterium]|jgi:small-conductance mechanosensitive channel|nr:mechanosensitive ion channel family protein [Spirochaetaceae bacterium]